MQNSSPILRCTFLAKKSAKLIATFSATSGDVTSVSLSLSLSLSLSHRAHLMHNIGSVMLPSTKKKRTVVVMYRVILKNLQFDFATIHRCVKSQVTYARGSAAESSTLIPQYHKILIYASAAWFFFFLFLFLFFFFFVQGSITCKQHDLYTGFW